MGSILRGHPQRGDSCRVEAESCESPIFPRQSKPLVFALCQEFARERIRSGRPGKIINLASIMSETVRSGAAVYAMTKGGIRQLTKALAVEWARHGIQ